MSKVFAFDVDGTLLDFVGSFQGWMIENGHHTPHDHSVIRSYETFFEDLYPHLDPKRQLPMIKDFVAHKSFLDLAPLDGAHDAIRALRAAYPGVQLIAVSSIDNEPAVIKARRHHLSSYELDDFIPVGLGEIKAPTLKKINASVFFDDHPHQVATAEAAGIHSVIVHQPWNRAYTAKHRLNHWREAQTLVQKLTALPLADE